MCDWSDGCESMQQFMCNITYVCRRWQCQTVSVAASANMQGDANHHLLEDASKVVALSCSRDHCGCSDTLRPAQTLAVALDEYRRYVKLFAV